MEKQTIMNKDEIKKMFFHVDCQQTLCVSEFCMITFSGIDPGDRSWRTMSSV